MLYAILPSHSRVFPAWAGVDLQGYPVGVIFRCIPRVGGGRPVLFVKSSEA